MALGVDAALRHEAGVRAALDDIALSSARIGEEGDRGDLSSRREIQEQLDRLAQPLRFETDAAAWTVPAGDARLLTPEIYEQFRYESGLHVDELRLRVQGLRGEMSKYGEQSPAFSLSLDDRLRLRSLFERAVLVEEVLLHIRDSSAPGRAERFGECRSAYRELLKDFAVFEERGAWLSPAQRASMKPQRGASQSSPAETYQRWEMEACTVLEARLQDSVFRPAREGESVYSALFTGGMSCFLGIMEQIEHNWDAGRGAHSFRALKGRHLYFEIDQAFSRRCRQRGVEPAEFAPGEMDAMIARTKSDLPAVVLLAPVSNTFDMQVFEVKRYLSALMEDRSWADFAAAAAYSDGRRLHVVIDNTILGRLARWKELCFDALPEFISVISFESLQKFSEDGLELASGGLATVIGERRRPGVRGELIAARQRLATMPPESTVRRLARFVDGDIAERRMMRHSRNARLLVEELTAEAAAASGIIAKVHHPFVPDHPQFALAAREMTGAVSLLRIELSFDSIPLEPADKRMARKTDLANDYLELVLRLAGSVQLDVQEGSSFGFDATRMVVYPRNPAAADAERSQPRVRVAVGTEDAKDALLLCAVLKRANEILGYAQSSGSLAALRRALRTGRVEYADGSSLPPAPSIV